MTDVTLKLKAIPIHRSFIACCSPRSGIRWKSVTMVQRRSDPATRRPPMRLSGGLTVDLGGPRPLLLAASVPSCRPSAGVRRAAIERALHTPSRWTRTRNPFVGDTRVRAVRAGPQKSGLHQRVEHGTADIRFNSAQTLNLRGSEPESGHLHELRSNAFDDVL